MDTLEDTTDNPYYSDGRQRAWNHSSLEPAKACPRKYYYSVIEGWRPKSSSDDIIFGSHYAKALESYHRYRALGEGYEAAVERVVLEAMIDTMEWESDHKLKNRENLIRSIIWYLDIYKNDPCKTLILDNGKPAVELSFRFRLDEEIELCGHLDRIVIYGDDVYIQDQKTTGASLGSYYYQRYNPNDQMSLYTVAGQIVYKQPIKGIMIDVAQIAVGFSRFERGFTFRTEAQTTKWLADVRYWIHRTWEAGEADWPLNDAACMLYGGCPFRSVCSKDPAVQQQYLETSFYRHYNNPLAERNE